MQAAVVSASTFVRLRALYRTASLLLAFLLLGGAPLAAQTGNPPPERKRWQWKEHPTLNLWPDAWVELRARFQHDVRASEAEIGDRPLGDRARRRIGIAGALTDRLEFQVEGELTGDDPWRDVYANYRFFQSVEARAGKFKLPFSFEENTSATDLDFVHRAMASEALAPGRDRGVMAHGRVWSRAIRYELGVFQHEGRNARSSNTHRLLGGRTAAGRITLRPFRANRNLLRSLEGAVAVTHSQLGEGLSSMRGDTVLGDRFYTADAFARGARQRLGFELRWEPGPFSVKSEYLRLSDQRLGQSVEDTDLPPLVASGWYVSGVWTALKAGKSWRGGLELAARLEELSFGSASLDMRASRSPRADVVLGSRDTAITVGANWALRRWIRVQANLIREVTERPTGDPTARARFWSRALRLQFVL